MSPTVFRYRAYRFFFFSREEERMHVHVQCPEGEAKFWLVPEIALAHNYGLPQKQIRELARIIEERRDDIAEAWARHFQR
jgi:hypothetical protein